jgi:YbbR domain-containing protein
MVWRTTPAAPRRAGENQIIMALREYISNNVWWKVLSLLLAALTYLTIQMLLLRDQTLREAPVEGSYTRSFPAIPVTLLTSTSNLNRFQVDPRSVMVRVSGAREALARLNERQVHAFVDVSDAGDEKQFRRPVQAQVPDEMQVDGLSPSNAIVERITVSN